MRQIVHGGDIYSPKNNKEILDFSANINPLGMPSSVKDAISHNIEEYINYPDPQCRDLRLAIANNYNISEDMIVCGNGAADIIYKIVLGIVPKRALLLAPTFSEYEEALKLVDCKVNYYSLKEETGFAVEMDILDKIDNIDILFLCNPNNPTGAAIEYKKVLEIAKKCKEKGTILVVDECFSDFLIDEEGYSIVPYIKEYNNVIILKAFTKIYAMAGIRLGYMISSNKDINYNISNILQPWSVSTVASKCGIAAIKEKQFVIDSKKYIKENREYLMENLKALGYKVFDSKVNYILFKTMDKNIKEKLENKGILIRSCSNYINLDNNFYRIAVKSNEYNRKLIMELKEMG